MISEIGYAIIVMQSRNVKKENMLIAYSQLVKRQLERELYENRTALYQPFKLNEPFKPSKIFDVEIFDRWPRNEIVIYSPELTPLYPELMTIITIQTDAIRQDTTGV